MKVNDDDLRAIWQQSRADGPPDRSNCLTDTEWARLISQEADAAERSRVASHIASCAICAEEYRLLLPLQSWGEDVDRAFSPAGATRADRWAAWRGWWTRRVAIPLAAAVALFVTNGVTLYRLAESGRERTRLETELAKNENALSATQTSLSAVQERLRIATRAELIVPRLAPLTKPLLDVAIVDLESASLRGERRERGSQQQQATLQRSNEPQTVTVGQDAVIVTLILDFPALTSRSTLKVEVAASGQDRWVSRIVREPGTASLSLALPIQGYPDGNVVIRLFNVTRGRTLVATYPIHIRHTDRSP